MKNNVQSGFSGMMDIVLIGLLGSLFCLPVLTAGPALCAMYYAQVKCVRHGRGHAVREFFRAFKTNFFPALKVWLVYLFLLCLWLMFNAVTKQTDPDGLRLMTRVGVFLVLPLCFPLSWVFAYISRFANSTRDTLKITVFLSVKHFMRTVMMLATVVGFVFIASLAPVLIPLLPGFCCIVMSYQTEPVFRAMSEDMEDGNEDQWYNE